MKNVLIFGASGHGSVVLDILERSEEFQPVGFVDSFIKKGTKKNGYPVLGSEFDLLHILEKHGVYGGIVAVGDNWVRRRLVHLIQRLAPNFIFVNAVHPSAILGKNVRLGSGTAIMPGVIVNANSRIGNHCIVNTRASMGHDGVLSDFSSLAPGVGCGGNLRLGTGAAISLGSLVIENIGIGSWSVVGAGSLVLDEIPESVVAYGSPARIIRNRKAGEPYLGVNQDRKTLQLPLNYTA
ncbi:MAG: acetyltransferase [Robiginitalea sp.]|uniref:acetyltransferase n=1 Tax=Robiginitalea sp. TaxID=1902411 RepID=UPI003C74E642